MKGRLENEIKSEKNIQLILRDMPDFVSDYYYSIASAVTPKTCETYLKQIRGYLYFLKPDMRNIIVTDITENNIAKYLTIKSKKKVNGKLCSTSYSYQKTIWSSLNGLLEYLTREEVIKKNYIKNIKRSKYQDSVKRVEIKKDDIILMINKINEELVDKKDVWTLRNKLIFLLFVNTGMRRSALCEINIEDINFETKTITVIDKRRKEHVYYLSEDLQQLIKEWIKRRKENFNEDEDALFISSFKKRISSKEVYNVIKKYTSMVIENGISPHKLRAAFCTILYDETHDIEFVRDAVGHSNVNTTSRYIIKHNDARKTAADIMSRLV